VPEFLQYVVANKPKSTREVAEQNLLAVDRAMIEAYDHALEVYKKNLRDRAPIIVALLSSDGGKLILYRPGKEPLVAEPVPLGYQLYKTVAHSTLATFQLLATHLRESADRSWRGPLSAFRTRCQTALSTINELDPADADREILRTILTRNVAYLDKCLARGTLEYDEFQNVLRAFKPDLVKCMKGATRLEVAHWMKVVAQWKTMLGKDWEKMYAVTNTLYVTRQNNILYTLLAQHMGREAIGDRLLLFESTEFTPAPETMLNLLTRIVADRALGETFFKSYYLMDVELLGSEGQKAIADEATKMGIKPLIPPLAPFHSHEWPWRTNPGKGDGPASLDEIK
jgi:hypothetical protein